MIVFCLLLWHLSLLTQSCFVHHVPLSLSFACPATAKAVSPPWPRRSARSARSARGPGTRVWCLRAMPLCTAGALTRRPLYLRLCVAFAFVRCASLTGECHSQSCFLSLGQASPPSPSGAYQLVSAGTSLSCGLLTSGSVRCWGAVRSVSQSVQKAPVSGFVFGSCVLLVARPRLFPLALAKSVRLSIRSGVFSGPFISVSAGGDHACALMANGTARCWPSGL